MYHTFQAAASTTTEGGDSGKGARPPGISNPASRRISTTNACVECRRRKIRCDGNSPCGQCQWYQHPELCAYAKPAQRVVPSRKLVDRLQSQVDQYHSVFARLFPGKDLEDIVSLPREGLVNLAVTLPAAKPSPSPGGPIPRLDRCQDTSETVTKSETADSLEALEQAPEQEPTSGESRYFQTKIQAISDDVNGLSLSIDKTLSYTGVSSINAAMKVILKSAPFAWAFMSQPSAQTSNPSRSTTPPLYARDPDPNYLPPADIGERFIESFFKYVHVQMPMVDEDQFRHVYLYGNRTDGAWLALLNMVFALGSLSSSTCDNDEHIAFYQRAKKNIMMEGFGSSNIFVLQSMGLLSGYYLHWLNRPNEANALMGATIRMATALGLHREFGTGNATTVASGETPAEIRRRTWWTLYVLDTLGSLSTGRPSLGRAGPGVTTEVPRVPEQMNNAQYLASLRLLPIIHNIAFCKIATRVQDQLAARALIEFDELFAMDAELEKWREDMPPILRDVVDRSETQQRRYPLTDASPKPPASSSSHANAFDFSQPPERDKTACPDMLKIPRAVMLWRYQNLRMLMHRPILLATSLRKTSYSSMSIEEKLAVSRCRLVAGQTIYDIDATCPDNLIAGWNAVWMVYQAVMVPLVSLFSVSSQPSQSGSSDSPFQTPGGSDASATIPGSDDDVHKWRMEIEKAIAFFDRMNKWSVAARKSRDVVQRLYDATKFIGSNSVQALPQHHQQQQQQQSLQGQYPVQPHRDDYPMALPAALNSINPTNFAQQYGVEDFASGPGWGVNTSGQATTVEDFWQDMMWDTFPADSTATFADGIDSVDWWQQGVSTGGGDAPQWG